MKKVITMFAVVALMSACFGGSKKAAEATEAAATEVVATEGENCTCPEGECACPEGECACPKTEAVPAEVSAETAPAAVPAE